MYIPLLPPHIHGLLITILMNKLWFKVECSHYHQAICHFWSRIFFINSTIRNAHYYVLIQTFSNLSLPRLIECVVHPFQLVYYSPLDVFLFRMWLLMNILKYNQLKIQINVSTLALSAKTLIYCYCYLTYIIVILYTNGIIQIVLKGQSLDFSNIRYVV